MKKFIVIYYAPHEVTQVNPSQVAPETLQAIMAQWGAWVERCGTGLVDMGAPLCGGQNISPSGSSPSKKEVAGYSILQAENMDAAKKMLENHPHYAAAASCEIEIYEACMPGAN